MPLEPPLAALDVGINIINVARIQAGKVVGLGGGKQIFRRVELWRVGRETVNMQPVPLRLEEYPSVARLMRREPVPEEQYPSACVPAELLEATDDIWVLDRVGENAQEQLRPPPIGPTR